MCKWLLGVLLFSLSTSGQTSRFQFTENKMGSPFGIIFYHTDSAEARLIADQSFELVDSLNLIFSDYDSNSEISRLSAYTGKIPQRIYPILYDLMMI